MVPLMVGLSDADLLEESKDGLEAFLLEETLSLGCRLACDVLREEDSIVVVSCAFAISVSLYGTHVLHRGRTSLRRCGGFYNRL